MTDVARAWLLVAHAYLSAARRLLRVAAVDVSEVDPDPCGEAVPAWAGTSSGAVPMAVPANPREVERVRRVARQRERVGVVVRAAPTTNQSDREAVR